MGVFSNLQFSTNNHKAYKGRIGMDHLKKRNKYSEPDPKETQACELVDQDFKTMVSTCPPN